MQPIPDLNGMCVDSLETELPSFEFGGVEAIANRLVAREDLPNHQKGSQFKIPRWHVFSDEVTRINLTDAFVEAVDDIGSVETPHAWQVVVFWLDLSVSKDCIFRIREHPRLSPGNDLFDGSVYIIHAYHERDRTRCFVRGTICSGNDNANGCAIFRDYPAAGVSLNFKLLVSLVS